MAPSVALLFLSAGATLLAFTLYTVALHVYRILTSSLRDLPGPASSHWVFGNLKVVHGGAPGTVHERWVEEYGTTYRTSGMLSIRSLFTLDTKALAYILGHSDIYQKSDAVRYSLSRVLGQGLLVVEGEQHKLQRKIMNPAFGPAQVRALTEIFVEKALQLRDVWTRELETNGQVSEVDRDGNSEKSLRVDVLSGLNRMTLDVIGLAGFDYKFDALSRRKNELNDALVTLTNDDSSSRILAMLQAYVPILRALPTVRQSTIDKTQETMGRIGRQLLGDARAGMIAAEKDGVVSHAGKARDLLSLLVRANAASGDQGLSDDDVLAQIPTFFVAGHETTSAAVTWALYQLTQSPDVQARLRAELRAVPTELPDMDELNALPYLDNVVREVMRVQAPVVHSMRTAMRDDVIPLARPFVDRKGVERHEIRISKGESIVIPILVLNRSKEIWGEDAAEFKPERWDHLPETVTTVPGVWGHQLTFLAGPHACIGYRFSVVEIKTLLFTLLRAFEFELAVPAADIEHKLSVVQKPTVRSEPLKGTQMPLIIRAVRED
ncbi:hypothetical protein PLICRDRAFT_56724 [Plicaturopsis crispa FD-325 SS-3]|nr:hypothetical protein PLICRDRAFT_56724 [Plicaturopsis crispa FD-325 SS-3]